MRPSIMRRRGGGRGASTQLGGGKAFDEEQAAATTRTDQAAASGFGINRVPRIRLLPGERNRDFVLSCDLERFYLANTPQPLRDVAVVLLDTGMRLGEVLALEWRDVYPKPANGAKFGYLHVRTGKSRNARRNLCITSRVRKVLESRLEQTTGRWVFCRADGKKPISVFTLEDQHSRLRKERKLDPDCDTFT